MVEESGGLEAIDDVHYSGQVSTVRGTQGIARALQHPFLSVKGLVVLFFLVAVGETEDVWISVQQEGTIFDFVGFGVCSSHALPVPQNMF